MKTSLTTLLFSLIVSICFAQQKLDNGLLVEYYQAQRYQDANDYLKKVFPEPVTDVKVLSQLAYTSQMANKLPDAQSYYQRIYDIDTTNEAALFSIGNINLKRGNNQKAELFFKRILLTDSTNISVYTKLANIAANKKDTVSVVNYLEKANKLNAADVDIAVDLSRFYIAQKNFSPALQVLNKAAESDPDNILILECMEALLYKEKKWAENIAACKQLIAMDNSSDDLLYHLGVSYYQLKNYSCGAETLTSISPNGQTEYTCYFASLCYKGLKDYDQAIVWLNNTLAQAISGNTAAYYGEIADSREKQGQFKRASTAYQKGLEFRNDPAIYTALGDLYSTKLNDKVTAAKYYKLAAATYQKMIPDNGNPMNIYMLANIYDAQLKDTLSAIKYYKKFLDTKSTEKQQSFINYTKSRIDQLQTKH